MFENKRRYNTIQNLSRTNTGVNYACASHLPIIIIWNFTWEVENPCW